MYKASKYFYLKIGKLNNTDYFRCYICQNIEKFNLSLNRNK